jgi:hypothetical protein
MKRFEATVNYDVYGKTTHIFLAHDIYLADDVLLDIMDWFGYDVIDYKIEEIK